MPNKKKSTKIQQFIISAKKQGAALTKPKGKPKGKINQFTTAQREAFELERKASQSTWSRIDDRTINAQCDTCETWDEIDDN